MKKQTGYCSTIIGVIGLAASCIGIFAFFTGWQDVWEVYKDSSESAQSQPTSVDIPANTTIPLPISTPVPTSTNLPTQLPPPTWYISSIRADIKYLRFFEGENTQNPVFKDRFDGDNSRYIFWNLEISYPASDQRVFFTVYVTYTFVETEEIVCDIYAELHTEPNWTGSRHTYDGCGSGNSGGIWGEDQRGKYRVDIYFDGDRVATGTFEVY